MQSFQLSQCTSIHTHLIGSALFSLLAISWNTKEVEKADRNGQYFFLCVGEIFVSFSRQLVLQSFAGENCVIYEQGIGFSTYDDSKVEKALDVCKSADVIVFACGQNSIGKFGGDQGDEKETSVT